jgi:hypothetical protein
MQRNKRKRKPSTKKEKKIKSNLDEKAQEVEITSEKLEEIDKPRYSPRKHKLSGTESFRLGKEKFLDLEMEGKIKANVGDYIAVDHQDGVIAIKKTEDVLDRKVTEMGYFSPYRTCYRKKRPTLTAFSAQSFNVPNEGNKPFLYARLSTDSDSRRAKRRFGLGICMQFNFRYIF